MRRIKIAFCLIIMLLGLYTSASAVENSYVGSTWLQEGDYEYVVRNDGDVAITRYSGNEAYVEVPDSFISGTVVEIGNNVFLYHDEIETVELPDSIQTIGERSFAFCENLSYINIPKNVVNISEDAFCFDSNLNMIDVSIENTMYKIEDNALINKKNKSLVYFMGTAPKEYVVPDGIKRIGKNFMYGQENLISVNMPDSVRSIGENAFEICKNLSQILFSTKLDYIEDGAFACCYSLKEINLPTNLIGIGENAFFACDLKKVVLPENLKVLGEFAFSAIYSLEQVEIPAGINKIGDGVFSFCSNLREVQISPGNLTHEIINNALYDMFDGRLLVYCKDNNTRYYKTAEGTKIIGAKAFEGCDIVEEIDISEGVTEIGEFCFSSCDDLRKVTLPSTVTNIGASAFKGCMRLETVMVSEDNAAYKSIDGVLFTKEEDVLLCYPSAKTDTDYEVPNSVKRIEKGAFYMAELQTISLPSSVNYIERNVFSLMDDNVLFKVPKDSYAEQYVIENNLLYEIY